MLIEDVKKHVRRRDMSGIERDTARIKDTSEVFTPTEAVQYMLSKLDQSLFVDPTKTFIDASCGDGQFLSEILILKMEHGSTYEQALSTIYGVDLMPDNVIDCRERLLCGSTNKNHIDLVEQRIVNANALTYNYTFSKKSIVSTKELKEIVTKQQLAKIFEGLAIN